MTIQTILHETPYKGIGLFALDFIKKGTIVYVDDTTFDKIISRSEYNTMSKVQKEFIDFYASYNKKADTFYLCCDNARFFNHSETPNTRYIDNKCIAVADIPPHTELTGDYREFCDICKDGEFGFKIVV